MKKSTLISGLLGFAVPALILISCEKQESAPLRKDVAVEGTKGNGAPSGEHYNLNIIGVPNGKKADMTDNNGHRIFIPLDGTTKIWCIEGDEFGVLDANGTDADGASYQMPNPDPDGDGVTKYSVYIKVLGKPDGSMTMKTCATDADGYTLICGTEVSLTRSKGASKFQNVTKQLLYIDRVPLFSEEYKDYFWQYDSNGMKNCQIRFYEIPTNTN